MQPQFIIGASAVIVGDPQSEVGSELESTSRQAAHEGMEHQMRTEWAAHLIHYGE